MTKDPQISKNKKDIEGLGRTWDSHLKDTHTKIDKKLRDLEPENGVTVGEVAHELKEHKKDIDKKLENNKTNFRSFVGTVNKILKDYKPKQSFFSRLFNLKK